jgi:hypothetical protein
MIPDDTTCDYVTNSYGVTLNHLYRRRRGRHLHHAERGREGAAGRSGVPADQELFRFRLIVTPGRSGVPGRSRPSPTTRPVADPAESRPPSCAPGSRWSRPGRGRRRRSRCPHTDRDHGPRIDSRVARSGVEQILGKEVPVEQDPSGRGATQRGHELTARFPIARHLLAPALPSHWRGELPVVGFTRCAHITVLSCARGRPTLRSGQKRYPDKPIDRLARSACNA